LPLVPALRFAFGRAPSGASAGLLAARYDFPPAVMQPCPALLLRESGDGLRLVYLLRFASHAGSLASRQPRASIYWAPLRFARPRKPRSGSGRKAPEMQTAKSSLICCRAIAWLRLLPAAAKPAAESNPAKYPSAGSPEASPWTR
jgi:hypothetical protein